MKKTHYSLCVALCLLSLPVFAKEPTVDELMEKSRKLEAGKQYDKAMALLQKAHAKEPENDDVTVAIAQLYGWEKQYDKAEAEIKPVLARHPDDADAQLVQANLDYYQGHYNAAEMEYAAIAKAHPDYKEASDGLKDARAAEAEGAGFQWALDTGLEYSNFSRQDQANWNNQFAQLTRFFDGGNTALHARVERYDEFTNIDSYYEVGIDQRFGSRLYGYLLTGAGPAADYRPRFRVGTGGGARIDPPSLNLIPVWLTLDTQRDHYIGNVNILNLNPGIRIEPWDNWALSYKEITVHQDGAPTGYGYEGRLDGQFWEGFRFYGGYANAPETVDVQTVDTISVFGGIAYDIMPALTLHTGYTRDNRENSYIRNAYNASVTYRF